MYERKDQPVGQLLQFDCAVDGLKVPALQETQALLLVDPVAELYVPVPM